MRCTRSVIMAVSFFADFEWAISLNRVMLKTIGLWPQDIRDSRQIVGLNLRRLCNLIMLLFILTIPKLISLIKIWGDMILMIDNLQYSLSWLMVISKICIIWYKQEVLAPLIDMVKRDWMKVKMKEERDVMLRCARVTRVMTMCGLFTIFMTLLIIFGFPCYTMTMKYVTNVTELEKSLPIQMYYPHDVSKSPQFELTFLAQAIAVLLGGFSYSGIDNLMGLLVLHVCGQLENLYSRLIYIGQYSNFDAVLKYNVQDHVRLIRSIEIVDDIFHLMLLGLILYFAITFSLQGFLIVNVLHQKDELSVVQLVWFILACITIMLHMCLYCAVGEILVIQSEKIHHATYEYAWYTIEPKTAKNLIIVMLRANKPIYITAGKMFPMTMTTFCSLLKTSASYISVLLANQD